ncbi:MAG TPA: putative hydroxymethylpyrimidine transporter CytX [Actinomycetota bacterium]|nr:putative hydroxymethylpyrimidine transporter CytX [Actinomycetota bacterium]
MSRVSERVEQILQHEAPAWGIRPVPPESRQLGGLDLGVLWFDLSIGLLVMVTGALLVPALGLGDALLAIAVGTAVGCVPLALVALAGQREGVPTMVLLRPMLGGRGSAVPSVLNVIQLVGWTAVEFWVMGEVANVVSARLFGFESRVFWLALVAIVCTGLAMGGPVLVVRRWLERFGIYVLLGAAVWITVEVLRAGELGSVWREPGRGGLPFWLAVDLVIVMPVSWLPLAADYNRFARPHARAALGTYAGYAIGNAWFYALGALLVLVAGASADALGIGSSIVAVAGGGLALVALLVGESDNAFADIYSAAVSTQNVAHDLSQRVLVGVVGAVGFVLALAFTAERYEQFLFLIGSVFVPLAAVFLADYFVRSHGRYGEQTVFGAEDVRWLSFVPWVVGFVVYQWCVPTGPQGWVEAVSRVFDALALPFPLFDGRMGASIPSFAVAFALALLLPRRAATR